MDCTLDRMRRRLEVECEGRVALERECYESTQGEAIQHRAIQHRRRNSSRQGGDNH